MSKASALLFRADKDDESAIGGEAELGLCREASLGDLATGASSACDDVAMGGELTEPADSASTRHIALSVKFNQFAFYGSMFNLICCSLQSCPPG